ncbi:unnamed protein product [Medioppia subpectinata]|uniref:TNFR-Cys domain-containing protein n=1 Tax=Medioppia subpectinata TaxID=1979941 RepID=A0A7R9KBC6_9ACAR|nr:unnamed protein product [Medioppia subpectinata]CAG2100271.1 unnamed protein product [Medioppia subpectinata]
MDRGSRNTVCRKCPPGTFSGVQTGTIGCILCTKCNSDEVMLEECSGVHDSICIDQNRHQIIDCNLQSLAIAPAVQLRNIVGNKVRVKSSNYGLEVILFVLLLRLNPNAHRLRGAKRAEKMLE